MERLVRTSPGPERESAALAVLVRSAIPLDGAQQKAITQLCTERYGPLQGLRFEIDPAIIGGIWIRIGDMVIDGSVAGRIEQLRHALKAHLRSTLSLDRQDAP